MESFYDKIISEHWRKYKAVTAGEKTCWGEAKQLIPVVRLLKYKAISFFYGTVTPPKSLPKN